VFPQQAVLGEQGPRIIDQAPVLRPGDAEIPQPPDDEDPNLESNDTDQSNQDLIGRDALNDEIGMNAIEMREL
jgi:hypothetical protein